MIKRLLFKTDQGASKLAECGPRKKRDASEWRGSFWARTSPLPQGRAWRQGLLVAAGRRRKNYDLGRLGQAELMRLQEAANCPGICLYPKASWGSTFEANGLCI